MTDAAVVGRLLDEYHYRAAAVDGVRVLSGSVRGERVCYEVRLSTGESQVIRAFRADGSVPVHARLAGSLTVTDFLVRRARVLAQLAEVGYPAPRPVLTRTGELVGVEGPWLSWATSDIAGEVVQPTLDQLRLLGATLARLHGTAPGDLASASADPRVAVPAIMTRLAAVSELVPAGWLSLRETLVSIAGAVGSGADGCVRSVVHGDAWARNVVQSGPASVVLLDWETAGAGLAVLDLGHCLMECKLDASLPEDKPEAWLIEPDEARIAAVCSGYVGVRRPSSAEIALLPDAVRFSAAMVAANHLEVALLRGVGGPSMDARLDRLRNRLQAGVAVAEIARRYLTSS